MRRMAMFSIGLLPTCLFTAAVGNAQLQPVPAEGWVVHFSAQAVSRAKQDAKPLTELPGGFVFSCRSMVEMGKDGALALDDLEAIFRKGEVSGRSGVLRGKGRMNGNVLTLQLEWIADDSPGVRSEWTLKPSTMRAKFGSGDSREVPAYIGARVVKMPAAFGGAEQLVLSERIEIYKAPAADLELAIGKEVSSADGRVTIKATVKNHGPDPSYATQLRIMLPDGAKLVAPSDDVVEHGAGAFDFPVKALDKNATSEVLVTYEEARSANRSAVLLRVVSAAYDPNPGNNGQFARPTSKKPATK